MTYVNMTDYSKEKIVVPISVGIRMDRWTGHVAPSNVECVK